MNLILILALYGIALLALSGLGALSMDDTLRLVVNIVAGIGALILPIYIYSMIDTRLAKRAVTRVGNEWCECNAKEFLDVESHKNHFALIYLDGERKERKKFRIKFIPTTWQVRKVEWI